MGHYHPQGSRAYTGTDNSCVKSIKGLFIKNFNSSSIWVNAEVVNEMERLSTKSIPTEVIPRVVTLPKDKWIEISQLTVHSFLAKHEDIKC